MGALKIFDGNEYKPVGVTINQTINQFSDVEMDLLWENASPTSAITEPFISLNLEGYMGVLVGANEWGGNIIVWAFALVGTNGAIICNNPGASRSRRNFIVSETGVQFRAASLFYDETNAPSTDQSCLIPQYIYGIKNDSNQAGGKAPLELVYPVGAVYVSTVATNPAELFGFGTWTQIKDTFLLAAGDTYEAGSTGGEAEHTLTVEEMPNHEHDRIDYNGNSGWTIGDGSGIGGTQTDAYSYKFTGTQVTSTAISHFSTSFTGGSQPHNNMPPYLAVYVWQRIA